MKLHILSDLHIEFASYEPDRETVEEADVIVLAGDINNGLFGLLWANRHFEDKEVVYVAGNHEFYGDSWNLLLPDLRELAKGQGIHFLEDDSVTIGGIRFLGCTLWTDFELLGKSRKSQCMRQSEAAINDFRRIEARPLRKKSQDFDFTDELQSGWSTISNSRLTAEHTLARHQASIAWLRGEIMKGDPNKTVVVTHHYPHINSCAPKWAKDPVSSIFGSNLPEEVLLGAKLWVHGHTHDSSDYEVKRNFFGSSRVTRVVANPRGYPLGGNSGVYENAKFDPKLLVVV